MDLNIEIIFILKIDLKNLNYYFSSQNYDFESQNYILTILTSKMKIMYL